MPCLKLKQIADDGSVVKLHIDLEDDGAFDHVEAFAKFMVACGFTMDSIATGMTAWTMEFAPEGDAP
jgi:hypothetical protein